MGSYEEAVAAALAKQPQKKSRLAEMWEAEEKRVQNAPEAAQNAQTAERAYSFTLPIPPSANNFKAVVTDSAGKPRMVKTWMARQYTKEVVEIATPICWSGPIGCLIAMTMKVYRKRKSGDLLNYEKVPIDALKGLAFIDDGQIVEAHLYRYEDKANPRIEIELKEIKE